MAYIEVSMWFSLQLQPLSPHVIALEFSDSRCLDDPDAGHVSRHLGKVQ